MITCWWYNNIRYDADLVNKADYALMAELGLRVYGHLRGFIK